MKPEFIIQVKDRTLVLYAGLLDEAHQQGLKSIMTILVQLPTPENGHTAIVHATVETTKGLFDGLGDANPGNVAKMLTGHIIRMAETRAKARALRDAVNVGATAFEELGDDGEETTDRGSARSQRPAGQPPRESAPHATPDTHTIELTPPDLLAEIELHRVRLDWQEATMTGWVKSRTEGRTPAHLTAAQATEAITALERIPDRVKAGSVRSS